MTPQIHSPIAKTKGDELVIGCYDRPEPKKPQPYGSLGKYDISEMEAHSKWLQSYKEYAVREADEREVINILWETFSDSAKVGELMSYKVSFDSLIEKGIPCDELIPRLTLIEVPFKKEPGRIYPAINQKRFEWTLKPLSVVSEEVYDEMIQFLYHDCDLDSMTYTTNQIIEKLKSKYTITRK